MKRLIPLLLLALTACGSATDAAIADAVAGTMQAAVVQTGVAATQTVQATPTTKPTSTPEPEATATPDLPCSAEAAEYLDANAERVARWVDATDLAANSPRISMAQPIANLQSIRREMDTVVGPVCVADAHATLTLAMDSTISALLAFLAQEPESAVNSHFRDATSYMEMYTDAMATINAEALEATRAAETPTPSPTP